MTFRPWSLLALVLTLAALVPASAQAATGSWRDLADQMAAPWPGIQFRSGELPDYLDGLAAQGGKGGGTRYGDAFMGYALIQVGLREHDRTLIRTGLRAINFATSGIRPWPTPSVFEEFAIASAYNLARKRIPREPLFHDHRGQWAAYMRKLKTVHLQWETHFGNHWLVDALGVLELRRTGLRSSAPGAVLGSGRRQATRRAVRLINSFIPHWAGRRSSFVLSDPRDYPLAYHGLSYGFYARAVDLLGSRAHARTRRTLRQMLRASALMMAPDGDSAYFGRSQEQIWALGGTAYGAELTARLPGSGRREDRLAHAVAARAVARLRIDHPTGRRGPWITPAIAKNLAVGARGVDQYAGGPSMSALALVPLNWAIGRGVDGPPRGRIPADRNFARTVGQERGRFAVVRRGRTWFAVKMTRTRDRLHLGDLRYDAGIVMAERLVGGRWTELVPQRPLTTGKRVASAGPVLLRRSRGYFQGHRIVAGRSGTVRIHGVFRTAGGHGLRRAALVYRPTRCGVALRFRARRGEAFGLSAFFTGRPRLVRRAARDAVQRVTVSGGRVSLRRSGGTLSSGTQARLRRVAIVVRARRAQTVRVSYCSVRG